MEQLGTRIDNVHILWVGFTGLSQVVGSTQAYDAATQYNGVGVVGDRRLFADSHGY